MNQLTASAIVLARTDFGEADRILTLLTPDAGKLRLIAKGVRKIKSKLAGGIELFSVSDITYIKGRGEIGTLVSARLNVHYGLIVSRIERVQLGYDMISKLHKVTEDAPEPAYYQLLQDSFEFLNDLSIPVELIAVWFRAQLLRLAGLKPNLVSDTSKQLLQANLSYGFDFSTMAFVNDQNGAFHTAHIKFLRLLFAGNRPDILKNITTMPDIVIRITPLLETMLNTSLQV